MKQSKVKQLISIAQKRMRASNDPVHDIAHTERVVAHVKRLSKEIRLNQHQKHAIILAAWWHDVSRTITNKPSFLWMPLLDDLLSALMLWYETIRCELFGDVVGLSTRLVFCKSLGAGKLLSRILLKKEDRVLVDVLRDADALDTIDIERMLHIYMLVDSSRVYHYGYKIQIWWFLHQKRLEMRTEAALKYLIDAIRQFLTWIEESHILDWHIRRYGEYWTMRNITRGKIFLQHLELRLVAG